MSIERVNPEAINRLDRFWESLVGNADGAVAVEPDEAAMVRRLYAMDDAAGPDAAFVRRLEDELGLIAVGGADEGGRVIAGGRGDESGQVIAGGRESGGGRTSPRMGTRSAPTKGLRRAERVSWWASKPVEVAAAVMLLVAVGLAAFGAWQVAGPSASQSPVVPDLEMVSLFVSDAAGQGMTPIDPMTLQDVAAADDPLGGVATPEVAGWPSAWLASDDGSTVVRVDYRIDVSAPPSVFSVTVLDGWTGAVRTEFVHEGLYSPFFSVTPLLSGDGSRLLIPNEYFFTHVAGTSPGFAVYDTADGRLVSTVRLFLGGHSEQDRFFVSTDGSRLYALTVTWMSRGGMVVGTPVAEPAPDDVRETPMLDAYDLTSGEMVGGLDVSALVQGRPSEPLQMPAAALSPDGGTIAFVQADGSTLTLVDTASMAIGRTYFLGDGGRKPTPTPTPNREEESEALFNPPRVVGDAVFSPDGERLFARWARTELGELTIRVQSIDLRERAITADVVTGETGAAWTDLSRLDSRMWVSPDGTSLYVIEPQWPLGPVNQLPGEMRPWVLRRLDAETLAVEAEREFRGERSVLMWAGE